MTYWKMLELSTIVSLIVKVRIHYDLVKLAKFNLDKYTVQLLLCSKQNYKNHFYDHLLRIKQKNKKNEQDVSRKGGGGGRRQCMPMVLFV